MLIVDYNCDYLSYADYPKTFVNFYSLSRSMRESYDVNLDYFVVFKDEERYLGRLLDGK